MFSKFNLNGAALPPKTLCLTFDDGPGETVGSGPGPKTEKIAEYLASENIYATFFMVGKHIVQYPKVLGRVYELGHIIGNHAYCHHRTFSELYKNGWDFVSEIEWTDQLIKKFNPANDIYFRAPWGDFPVEVVDHLNNVLDNHLNHIGSFHWDIGSSDWKFWQEGKSSQDCADYYFNEISNKNHGLVLMHDSTSDLLNAKINNLTLETIKILIPQLKTEGYRFVNIDQVPY